jgi:Membrane bound beta barrel domain (DUF5777)
MNYRKRVIYGIYFISLFLLVENINAQGDDIFEDDVVSNIFSYGMLINAQTTEIVPKGSFELRIQHRFGEMDVTRFKETVVDEFLGFDGSANIRFGFSFGLSDKLQIGVGRTKINKVFDFEGKYKLIRQKEMGSPLSLTLYFNAAFSTREFPKVGPNEFFKDLDTPFEYKFSHRITYNTQLLLSKKIGEKISLELNPTILYKNLVPPGDENLIFVTTFGGRFKTGLTSSIIFEFTRKFNDRKNNYKDPISIGYEIGTAGHAFQMFVSTSNQILEQAIYFSQPLDYTKGKLLLGFNIKRTFWNGNK